MRPTILSPGSDVPLSIRSTRSSVGRMTGRKSVQLLSMNSWRRFSSVSGSSRRGVERSKVAPLRSSSFERLRQPLEHALHERLLQDRIGALDVGAQLGRRAADDGLRHVDLAQGRHAAGERAGLGEARKGVRADRNGRDAGLLKS